MFNQLNIKSPFLKKILTVFLGILGLFLILVIGTAANELWKSYKWQKAVDKFQESLEKPYKEDIYGGKTPEETWKMFLDALKAGDIELASRYFAVEKQEEEKQELFQIKQDKKLELLIKIYSQELKLEQKRDNKVYFYILREDIAGEKISDSIIFYLNPYTKIWKIVSL